MADFSTVQGSVTLRKMRTGATVQVSLSSTMQLFQLYMEEAGVIDYAPKWDGANTHPRVTVNLTSSSNDEYSGLSAVWYINNTNTSTIAGCSTGKDADGRPYLDINTNLAPLLQYNSGTLTAEISFSDKSGNQYQITKSEIIRIQQAVSNGYYVFIDATSTEVNEKKGLTAVLTATCRQGLNPVPTTGDGAAVYKWFTSTTQPETDNDVVVSNTLNVNAAMVNGSQLFICRAYIGGTEVDAESIMIMDTSDPMRIVASVVQYCGNSQAGYEQKNVTATDLADTNDSAVVTFKVVQADGSAFNGTADWTAQKMHAGSAKLIEKPAAGQTYTNDTTTVDGTYNTVTTTGTAEVQMTVYDADFYTPQNGNSGAIVKDEVVVTATAENVTASAAS